MSQKNDYDVDESVPMLMSNCVKHMRATLNARFAAESFNLSAEQWALLTHLASQDGLTQQQLADRTDRSKVATLNLLKKLEETGLVLRRPDPVDGRSNRVYLTRLGRETQQMLVPLAKANLETMLEGLSEEDLSTLRRIVRHITQNLR